MADVAVLPNDGVVIAVATVAGQNVFDFDFLVYAADTMNVVFMPLVGAEVPLTLGVHFTVAGLGVATGGSIALAGAYAGVAAVGDRVMMYRVTSIRRLFDYQVAGDFRAETINRELDTMTMWDQELRRDVNQTLRVEYGSTAPAPIAVGTAGQLLSWDGFGQIVPTNPQYFMFRGLYNPLTSYLINDVVRGLDGSTYIAKQPSSGVLPVDGAIWELFVPGGSVAAGSIDRASLTPAFSKAIASDLSEFAYLTTSGLIGMGGDDTPAVQAWLASGTYLTAPGGTYFCSPRVHTATIKSIKSNGLAIFKPLAGSLPSGNLRGRWDKDDAYVVGDVSQFMVTFETISAGLSPTGLMYRCLVPHTNIPPSNNPLGASTTEWQYVPFDDFFVFNSLTDFNFEGISFDVDCVLYPQTRTLNLAGCQRGRLEDVHIPNGGGTALYMGNCIGVNVDGIDVRRYGWRGIVGEGLSQRNNTFFACHVETTLDFVGTGNGIAWSLGFDCQTIACTSRNAGVFGMTANEVDGFTIDGLTVDSNQEGMSVISCKNGRMTGTCRWVARLSIDFGASVDGTTGSGCRNVTVDLMVNRSGVSALAVTGDVLDGVYRVTAKNCNQSAAADEAALLFSGTGCQGNTGYATLVDEYGPHRMPYCIAEIDKGNGQPSNNTLHVQTSRGHLIAEAKRLGPTTRIFGMASRFIVPVLSDGANNPIVAATVNSLEWWYAANGRDVEFKLTMTPTNIGAAAGNMLRILYPVALPLTIPTPVSNSASGSGEQATTGKQLSVTNTATHLLFKYYDAAGQPAVNGNLITARGAYTPAI